MDRVSPLPSFAVFEFESRGARISCAQALGGSGLMHGLLVL